MVSIIEPLINIRVNGVYFLFTVSKKMKRFSEGQFGLWRNVNALKSNNILGVGFFKHVHRAVETCFTAPGVG